MIVPEEKWQALESGLHGVLDRRLPEWRTEDEFEIHCSDLRTGRGPFKGMTVDDRITFRDEWMNVAEQLKIRIIYRSVHKKSYANWLVKSCGQGIVINPHVVAFSPLARCIDDYLESLPDKPLGILISDENKEIVADVEKAIRVLRWDEEGKLRLNRIVEKGFFIDSATSHPLQLCDLFAMSARKLVERRRGVESKTFDDSGIKFVERMSWNERVNDSDAINWLVNQRKKEAARG